MSQSTDEIVSFEVQGKSNSGYLTVPSGAGPWSGMVAFFNKNLVN